MTKQRKKKTKKSKKNINTQKDKSTVVEQELELQASEEDQDAGQDQGDDDDVVADTHSELNEKEESSNAEDEKETDDELVASDESSEQDDSQESFHEQEVVEVSLSDTELKKAMTTLLFMSDKPLSLPKIKSLVNPNEDLKVYREKMAQIKQELEDLHFGFEAYETARGWYFRTRVDSQKWVLKEKKISRIKLTPAAIEVLSVIAYKQPISKSEIDQMRAVDTSYILRNLLEKRLIKITGRADTAGRSTLYSTTDEFLDLLGLKDLSDLPSRTEIEEMVPDNSIGGIDEEQKLQIHSLVNKRGGIVDMYQKLEEEDEKMLLDLRDEIGNIDTSTSYLEQEKIRTKLRLKFEKLKSKKRSEFKQENPDANLDQLMEEAGFGENGFELFLEQNNVGKDGDDSIDFLIRSQESDIEYDDNQEEAKENKEAELEAKEDSQESELSETELDQIRREKADYFAKPQDDDIDRVDTQIIEASIEQVEVDSPAMVAYADEEACEESVADDQMREFDEEYEPNVHKGREESFTNPEGQEMSASEFQQYLDENKSED